MTLTIHLAFDGCCEEAFRFYERCLGGKLLTMLRWSETPMATMAPPGYTGKILHATLEIGDGTRLAGSDSMPGQHEGSKGFHVLLGIKDQDQARRVFAALAEGGTVTMPLQKTFWAVLFGVLTDRFGISWEINCEPTGVPPA